MSDPTALPGIPDGAFTVRLRLQPVPQSVRPARSVAASLGTDAGMNVDELDDLRVAVQEALALLVSGAEGTAEMDTVEMDVAVVDDIVIVGLQTRSSVDLPGADHFGRQLLEVLVAEHLVSSDGDRREIWLRSHPAGS